jgi:hypothetical protein
VITHLVKIEGDYEADITFVEMYCGLIVTIGPDPENVILPDDADFVDPPDPKNLCDCDPCLNASVEPLTQKAKANAG